MKKNFLLLLALAFLALVTPACLRAQRAHRNRALAERAEAEAELARAKAEAIRSGEDIPEEEEYVEGDAPEPPAAIVEEVPPAPNAAHVWIAGCHVRHGGRWVWTRGHWALPPRHGAVWVPGHWARRDRGFVWIIGGWR